VFSLRAPSDDVIRAQVQRHQNAVLTYEPVGLAASPAPAGWNTDHNHIQLGSGRETLQIAREALCRWRMFDVGWASVWDCHAPIQTGTIVVILAHYAGLWSYNLARIVQVIDEPNRFGFHYGTLPHHIEHGEERFLVEWDPATDAVKYDLRAVSRPAHWLARLTKPIVRRQQDRFAKASLAAMTRACSAAISGR
jgi:uncharacterized protein (UPF0548 family)